MANDSKQCSSDSLILSTGVTVDLPLLHPCFVGVVSADSDIHMDDRSVQSDTIHHVHQPCL